MPLQRQNIPLPFVQGADTKTDDFILPPGKLTVMQNAYLTSNSTLRKRPGNISLGSSIVGGGNITTGRALASYGSELVPMDSTSLYSYSAASTGFVRKGNLVSCQVTQTPIIRTTGTQSLQDMAVNTTTGLTLVTYQDVTAGVTTIRYSIIDTVTGQVQVANQVLDAAASYAKPIAVGTYLVAVYSDNTNHRIKYIAFTGTTAQAAVDVSGATFSLLAGFFDACVLPGVNGSDPFLCICWNNTDASGGISGKMFRGSTLVAYSAVVTIQTGNFANTGLCIFPDTSLNTTSGITTQRLIVVYASSANVRIVSQNSTFTGISGIADQLVEALAANCYIATGCSFNTNNTPTARIYYTQAVGTNNGNDLTRWATITTNTVAVQGVYVRGHSIAAKPFVQDSTMWLTVAYDPNATGPTYTGQQPSYFVISDGGKQAARLLYGNGGGRGGVIGREWVNTATGVWISAFQQRDLLTTVPQSPNLNAPTASGSLPSYVYTTTGVTTCSLNFFDQQASYSSATLADVLHISGGQLMQYDGTNVVEHGFNLYPENVTVAMAGAAGALSAGTYVYYAVYEWMDAQGRRHQSAPSPGVSVTAAALNTATVTVPTYRLGAKSGVTIVVYRTQVNTLVPFRLGSPSSPTANNAAVDSVAIPDAASDASISAAPPLYVLGNVAENIPLGPCNGLVTYKDRLMAVASDDPLSVWYSKPVLPGSPVEFNDGFTIRVDPIGGALTALAVMDDKLIIFKQGRILFSQGDGPDSTGQGGSFSPPQLITTDCGCVDPRSVTVTPDGIIFRGLKGIYMLSRGLAVSYMGSEVEDIIGSSRVVSGTVSPNIQQVRLGLSDNKTIVVYDYLFKQWGWYVNPELASVGATLFQSAYTYLQPSGTVGQESQTVFTDFGNFIPMVIETGWLNLADLNGFQRVYQVALLGRYQSAHTLRFSAAYDNAEAYTKSGDLASASLFDPGLWGGSTTPTWGATPPTLWGGPGTPYVARFDLAQQKCRTIKFRIEDLPYQGSYGESLQLTGLTLLVGTKTGLGKLPAGQTVGVS